MSEMMSDEQLGKVIKDAVKMFDLDFIEETMIRLDRKTGNKLWKNYNALGEGLNSFLSYEFCTLVDKKDTVKAEKILDYFFDQVDINKVFDTPPIFIAMKFGYIFYTKKSMDYFIKKSLKITKEFKSLMNDRLESEKRILKRHQQQIRDLEEVLVMKEFNEEKLNECK